MTKTIRPVLLAHGEDQNRAALKAGLEWAGYPVREAADRASAIEAIERAECELVVMGDSFAGGADLIRILRATYAADELPVIVAATPLDIHGVIGCIESQRARGDGCFETDDGAWECNLKRGSVALSPRWNAALGLVADESAGEGLSLLTARMHAEDRPIFEDALRRACALDGPDTFVSEYRLRHQSGVYRSMLCRGNVIRAAGAVSRVIASQTDVTERRAVDSLTGLASRASFRDSLEIAIEAGAPFTLLCAAIDRFQAINESFGSPAGDRLIREMGQRIATALGPAAAVARIGADEFAVVIPRPGAAAEAARALSAAVPEPYTIEGREMHFTASVGMVTWNQRYRQAAEMLRDAASAVSKARAVGRGAAVFFDEAMHSNAVARLELETDLEMAVRRGEFVVHYQPKLHLGTGVTTGFEALVRWLHPTRGLLLPGEFIHVAEETGLIVDMGFWVIEEACRTLKRWQDRHPRNPPLEMSVNLSVRQFRLPGLATRIAEIVAASGVDPRTLQIEVTESVLIEDSESAAAILQELKALGVGLKIDDFGAGYSSLLYLTNLPFDALKIDRMFVDRMCRDRRSLQVIKTILLLAENLGLQSIAEGVENREQLAQLRTLGCEYGQGYYFYRPMPAAQVESLLSGSPGM